MWATDGQRMANWLTPRGTRVLYTRSFEQLCMYSTHSLTVWYSASPLQCHPRSAGMTTHSDTLYWLRAGDQSLHRPSNDVRQAGYGKLVMLMEVFHDF